MPPALSPVHSLSDEELVAGPLEVLRARRGTLSAYYVWLGGARCKLPPIEKATRQAAVNKRVVLLRKAIRELGKKKVDPIPGLRRIGRGVSAACSERGRERRHKRNNQRNERPSHATTGHSEGGCPGRGGVHGGDRGGAGKRSTGSAHPGGATR